MVPDHEPASEAGRLQTRVLIASTRADVRQRLAVLLSEAGFLVGVVPTAEAVAQRIAELDPHVTVVADDDVSCPLLDIARHASDAPILAVVPADAPAQAVAAQDQGADDCISLRPALPDDPAFAVELLWRVNGVLRRAGELREPLVGLFGPSGICLRPLARDLTVRGRICVLSHHEFEILRVLLERRGEVVPIGDCIAAVWGPPLPESRGWVHTHVSHIRAKLREAGAENVIATVRGFGYVIR